MKHKCPNSHYTRLKDIANVCMGVFFLFNTGMHQLAAQNFVRSAPPECRCQFEMPGIPKAKVQQLQTDIGPVDYHSYISDGGASQQHYTFVVNFADYPEGAISLDSAEFVKEFFESSIEQATDQLAGTMIYKTDIALGEAPGMLYRIDYGNSMTVKSKVLLHGKRFYLLQAFYQRDKERGFEADKFLNSFRIE